MTWATGGGRFGAGLAESGGLRRVRGGGGVAAGIGRVHGPVGGLNLRFGGGDGGLRFGERGLRGGEELDSACSCALRAAACAAA